jgi:hypothetical protein
LCLEYAQIQGLLPASRQAAAQGEANRPGPSAPERPPNRVQKRLVPCYAVYPGLRAGESRRAVSCSERILVPLQHFIKIFHAKNGVEDIEF